MQTSRTEPEPKAIVDQHFHPARSSVGKEIRVMRSCLTEDAHDSRKCRIGTSAHVERFDREPRRIDPDHVISSRSHTAQALAALVGHSIVIRALPLWICTRIERSGDDDEGDVDGVCIDLAGSVSGTGKNAVVGAGPSIGNTADRECLIHMRSMFAFNCNSRATAATDAPGLPQAA